MRLLVDEDFNQHIVRGLVRRLPDIDVKSVVDLALRGREDAEILRAAARDGRLLLSHDVNTMTAAFEALRAAGEATAGVLLVPQRLSISDAIEDLEVICVATENAEWLGVLAYLPI